ncbi:hypothetical protein TNCV_456091 [Trichonephila clavipes]|nr:hypothetical protein TNCV_456091 [Trichonephila clavipes]
MKSNTTPNDETGCRTSVAMHNATAQQSLTMVSPNSNPTIVILHAEAGFVRKHDVFPFRYPSLKAKAEKKSCDAKSPSGYNQLTDILIKKFKDIIVWLLKIISINYTT